MELNQTSTYSIKAQIPEQRLHQNLSQVGVRVAGCGAVRGVRRGCEALAGGQNLGAVSRRAVTQERGHVGVVLQTGQDDVQLHPLINTNTQVSIRLLTLTNKHSTVIGHDIKLVHCEVHAEGSSR